MDWLDEALAEGLRDWAILESARQSMYSVEENIKRGMMAMRHVIETHKIEPKAMWRSELGWIGFEWGEPGETPPEFASHAEFRAWQKTGRKPYDRRGYGVAHIIAKRDWEGRHIEEFLGKHGIDEAYRIVKAIAYGSCSASQSMAKITWRGLEVILKKETKGGDTYWLITGYSRVAKGYKYVPRSAGFNLPSQSAQR